MTLNNSGFDSPPSSIPLNYAAQKLSRLHTDLVSTARTWAIDEVGAAITHQLSEPLTALLLYLNKIKEQGERSTGADAVPHSVQEMVVKALRETERLCSIMERLGHTVETTVDAETAVARGREVIDAWTRRSSAKEPDYAPPASPYSIRNPLTPREHEVLALIIGGASNKEGGHRLGITTRTFEVHRAHIMEKIGAKNAADLVRRALSQVK